jgi:hypothetical protein
VWSIANVSAVLQNDAHDTTGNVGGTERRLAC